MRQPWLKSETCHEILHKMINNCVNYYNSLEACPSEHQQRKGALCSAAHLILAWLHHVSLAHMRRWIHWFPVHGGTLDRLEAGWEQLL